MKGFAEVMNIGIDEKGAVVEYAFFLLKDVLGITRKLCALVEEIVSFRIGRCDAHGEQCFSDGLQEAFVVYCFIEGGSKVLNEGKIDVAEVVVNSSPTAYAPGRCYL